MVQVLDFLLVMDIVLQFFRAYVNKKSVLVVKMSRIRRNYLGLSQELADNASLLHVQRIQLSVTSHIPAKH